jgi:SEC-C motif
MIHDHVTNGRVTVHPLSVKGRCGQQWTRADDRELELVATSSMRVATFVSTFKRVAGQIETARFGRVAPCPCGSGKAFDDCHGRHGLSPLEILMADSVCSHGAARRSGSGSKAPARLRAEAWLPGPAQPGRHARFLVLLALGFMCVAGTSGDEDDLIRASRSLHPACSGWAP